MYFSPNKYHKLVALISHPFYPIGSSAFQDYYFWLIPVVRYAYLPIRMFSCSNAQKIPHKSWNHYLLCLNHSNRLIQTNAIMIPIAINRSGAIGPNKAITSVVIVDACLRNFPYTHFSELSAGKYLLDFHGSLCILIWTGLCLWKITSKLAEISKIKTGRSSIKSFY